MMQRRLKAEALLRAIASVADDGFTTAAELHPALPKVSRRDLERGLARAANRGHVVLRRTPEGRRFAALTAEGWRALREAEPRPGPNRGRSDV
jgi:DNA repair photolyase